MAVIRDHQISEFHHEFDNGSFRLRLDEAEARVSDPERLLDVHERSLVESKGEISTKNVRITGLEHEVSDVLQASIKSDQELNAIRSEVAFLRKDNESIVKDIETARAETEKLKIDLFAAEDKIKETKRLHLAAMDDKQRQALNRRRKMIHCKSALDNLSRKFKSQLKYKLQSKNHLRISFSHLNTRRLYLFHRPKKCKRQTLKVKKRKCFEDKLNHMV
ncbi:hypothetical protein I3843_16G017800 [Carya illinoinensis]|uniref:Uncharacterized protein n=1 Tax=Carya illinoinensis TaxID=32201 RepID=A0A8T1N4X5_CARIL|nr:rho-associated protein kinase let-502-like [Carya illinoinensis]XP_042964379.1 rho-associated protein kinase let-502-like [Carya illinoinensis]XP_042964380.1 rho-associated protein kinase let-502-like [Carya illinoinensis]XP_042964381.1 rho-associated protein kinase let-502-like [Carya illinoinensis]XP_042964382.1 rho-associated protein kinase let-502-like [Carya illinoinensis]XP_042964383.1 rho-associated protein kinase let-502-like [Carya illinoinensis]KAG6624290.1 hypothetical protein C